MFDLTVTNYKMIMNHRIIYIVLATLSNIQDIIIVLTEEPE